MTSRILVVDDSPTIRRVVSAILERHGYETALAFDGQDAMEALSSGEVKADLVLLDFVMPRMNGYQFCRALRSHPELAMTPVILMSAKSDRIRDQFVQQTGAIDAIEKPFDAQAIVTVVENALRRVKSGSTSSARLPELDPEEPEEPDAQLIPDLDTRRTNVAEIVAMKLAFVVTRTMAERPNATPAELTAALTEQLANDALLEMVEAIRYLERGKDGSAHVLSGNLGAIPIGAILQLLQIESQTGILTCRNGAAEVVATVRNGLIDLVQSSGAGDEFRLGRYFVEEGIVTSSQIDEVMTSMRSGDDTRSQPSSTKASGERVSGSESDPHTRVTKPTLQTDSSSPSSLTLAAAPIESAPRRRLLGATLLAFGKINESQLTTALTRQSSELLYEVLRWTKGSFDFRVEPASRGLASTQLGLPMASVVMEGFRRVDEWRVLERSLGSFDAVLVRDELALRSVDMGTLPAKEKTVLDAIDGERSVRAIIAKSHTSSFDACRVLVQFLEARILRRRSAEK